MPRTLFALALPALALATLTLCGCDALLEKVQEGIQESTNAAATAGMTEDDKLGAKLDGYIKCINGASSRVLDAGDRYALWVDIKAGVTGEEKNVYGIYEVNLDEACVNGINNANAAEPDNTELEAIATTWLKAYQKIQPLIQTAHDYYDRDEHKDDDFAKGKEMHQPLVDAFDAFHAADEKLRKAVMVENDALQERRLVEIEKTEGRKLRFQNANIMAKAKHLIEIGDVHGLENLDADEYKKSIDAYEAAFNEADKYVKANKAETDSVMQFDSFFMDAAENYLKAGKELMRRKRDGKKFTERELDQMHNFPGNVEGSPAKLLKLYNDLINNSNRLNWQRYNPGA